MKSSSNRLDESNHRQASPRGRIRARGPATLVVQGCGQHRRTGEQRDRRGTDRHFRRLAEELPPAPVAAEVTVGQKREQAIVTDQVHKLVEHPSAPAWGRIFIPRVRRKSRNSSYSRSGLSRSATLITWAKWMLAQAPVRS